MSVPATTHMLCSAALLAIAPGIASAAKALQPDFNGDGYADLAMPVTGEKIGSAKAAGAVNVIYGSASGLAAANNQIWSQDSDGIADAAEAFDYFGNAITWGDFNNDGYSDLAIASLEDNQAGAVNVIYGSSSGLTSSGNQIWREGSSGLAGFPAAGEEFGYDLAVGDFNGDGWDDLAVSAWDEPVNGDNYAGVVYIIHGSASGLTGAGSQVWSQDSDGIQGAAEFADGFGAALAAGDFNGDGWDDLAVGTPYENFSVLNCGVVNVIYGSAAGLTAAGNQWFGQTDAGIADVEEEDDYFGWSLAAGDFNNDGKDDLAIGVMGENSSGRANAGAVHVLFGSGNGLRANGSQFWTQDSTGIADVCEAQDDFGAALATGDFNNDGYLDLAISAVGESVGSASKAGAVNVIYGSANGLNKAKNKLWAQGAAGMPDAAEPNDCFGSLLIVGDFDGNGRDDLAIGAPFENLAGIADCGMMNVVYGLGNGGLKANGTPAAQIWHQDRPGIADKCEKNDNAGLRTW